VGVSAAGFSAIECLKRTRVSWQSCPTCIGEHDPVITVALIRSRGTLPIYQAKIGSETRGSANDICRKIKTAGVACLVLRNAPARGLPTKSE
jgi:hypothetical protein